MTDGPEVGDSATQVPEPDTKPCPICAEEIKPTAVRCRFCKSDLTGAGPSSAPPPAVVLVAPPREFLAGHAFCSLLLIALSGWLLAVKIPQHDPRGLGAADVLKLALTKGSQHFLIRDDLVVPLQAAAVLLGLLGLASLGNSFREVGRVEHCRRCNAQVISRRRIFGKFVCERCGTALSGQFGAAVRVTAIAVFLLSIVGAGAAIAVSSIAQEIQAKKAAEARQAEAKRAEDAKNAWLKRALSVASGMSQQDQTTIAKGSTQIAHPSGSFDSVTGWTARRIGDAIEVRIGIAWKGGLIGTKYHFVVVWTFQMIAHDSAVVVDDDAPFGIGSAAPDLDTYFRDKVYPIVSSRAGSGQ